MSRQEFDEMIENMEYRYMSLADVRMALKNKWITDEDAEIIAGNILNC